MPLGPEQDVCVYNSLGSINFILDVNGWFGDGSESTQGASSTRSARCASATRAPLGEVGYSTECSGQILTPGDTLTVPVAGVDGPAPGVRNLSAGGGDRQRHRGLRDLRARSSPSTRPTSPCRPPVTSTSTPRQNVANLDIVQLLQRAGGRRPLQRPGHHQRRRRHRRLVRIGEAGGLGCSPDWFEPRRPNERRPDDSARKARASAPARWWRAVAPCPAGRLGGPPPDIWRRPGRSRTGAGARHASRAMLRSLSRVSSRTSSGSRGGRGGVSPASLAKTKMNSSSSPGRVVLNSTSSRATPASRRAASTTSRKVSERQTWKWML